MDRPLRIVHCFRSPVGGIFRHVRDLAAAQAAAGHQVGIVCDSTTGGAFEEQLFEGTAGRFALGVHRTPMQRHVGPGDLVAAFRAYRIIKRLRPDVLHGHGAKGGVYSRLFGSLLRVSRSRVARLYSPHGGSLHYDETTLMGRFFFLVESLMDRLTDNIIFVSAEERAMFARKVGGPRAPSDLVYNGLRPEEFEPVADAPGAADFLYIGMMRDLKGPDIFIDALAQAEIRLSRPLTAVMVGDGDDLPAYRERAGRLGLADRVAFRPAMPARQAFALARTVVVPSRAEAMPYVVLEVLAAARPLIATRVGGIPEIFGDRADVLVEPNAGTVGQRMVEAVSDPAGFGARMPAVETLRQRFGADVMARDIEAVYRRAIAGTGAVTGGP